jgi:Ca2+-binding EF-hand superfamily protein
MAGAELMEKRIREYMEVKSGFGDPVAQERMLAKEFKLFDRDGSGAIDIDEFKAVLKHLNCMGSDDDVDELFDKYDADCSDSITYKEFTDQLFSHKRVAPSDKEPNATKGIVSRVKEEIIKRSTGNGLRSAALTLKRMDTDRSGNLDEKELAEGLEVLGIEGLEEDDIKRLMRAFDSDDSGKISVEEFYRGLQGDMKRKRKVIVKMAFNVLDKDGSGEVDVNDIRGAYDCSQHPKVIDGSMTEDEALHEILETYEQGEADVSAGDGSNRTCHARAKRASER